MPLLVALYLTEDHYLYTLLFKGLLIFMWLKNLHCQSITPNHVIYFRGSKIKNQILN